MCSGSHEPAGIEINDVPVSRHASTVRSKLPAVRTCKTYRIKRMTTQHQQLSISMLVKEVLTTEMIQSMTTEKLCQLRIRDS